MAVRLSVPTDNDRRWMERTLELAERCVPEPGKTNTPLVAAVAVRDGELLAEAFRGELGDGYHAEYCLVLKLQEDGQSLDGATVYTTLEPCMERGTSKTPCALRVRDGHAAVVWIGLNDPHPTVARRGWRTLRDAGVALCDYPEDLRERLLVLNSDFLAALRSSDGVASETSFDYRASDGRFEITGNGHTFNTKWSGGSDTSVIAYHDDCDGVALATFAEEFGEIDDPGSLDFSSRARRVSEGSIVVFRSGEAFVLVRVRDVFARSHGDDKDQLDIDFEVRS